MHIINWVDVLIVAVLFRGIYTGNKSTFFNEFFKLNGVLFATFVALHYYSSFGALLKEALFFMKTYAELAAFTLLASAMVFIFVLIREGWLMILKMDLHPRINLWGSTICALFKSYLLCGLIFIALLISRQQVFVNDARLSMSSLIFQRTSVSLYRNFYLGFVSKMFPQEPINERVIEVAS